MTPPLSSGPEAAVVFESLTPPLCMDLTPPLYSGLLPEATDRALIELRRSVVIRTAIVSDTSLKSASSRHWRLTTANCTVDRVTKTLPGAELKSCSPARIGDSFASDHCFLANIVMWKNHTLVTCSMAATCSGFSLIAGSTKEELTDVGQMMECVLKLHA